MPCMPFSSATIVVQIGYYPDRYTQIYRTVIGGSCDGLITVDEKPNRVAARS